MAIFGLKSKPNGLSTYSTTSAQLRDNAGSTLIDISATGITVTAPNKAVNVQGQNVSVVATGTANVQGPLVTVQSPTEVDITAPTIKAMGAFTNDPHGATGVFLSKDNKTVTVVGGIVTSIV
jgi:hypothetical protein